MAPCIRRSSFSNQRRIAGAVKSQTRAVQSTSRLTRTRKQVLVAVCRHPFGAGKMAIIGAFGAFWLAIGINPQDNSGNFLPGGAFLGGVEQSQIANRLGAVVIDDMVIGRRAVRDRHGLNQGHVWAIPADILAFIVDTLANFDVNVSREIEANLHIKVDKPHSM
jgi:hypothetical protein